MSSGPDNLDDVFDHIVAIGMGALEERPHSIAIGSGQCLEHRHRELALSDVRPGGLSDRLFVGDQIQGVVGDLKDQPQLPRPVRESSTMSSSASAAIAPNRAEVRIR